MNLLTVRSCDRHLFGDLSQKGPVGGTDNGLLLKSLPDAYALAYALATRNEPDLEM